MLTDFKRLPGLDNRKMSKSYGNAISLSDDAETVRKKVMQMYTTRSEFGPMCRGRSKATPSSRIIRRSILTPRKSRISRRATGRGKSATSR